MGRLISKVIDEQKDKKITLTGEEIYQIFKDGFYSGTAVSGYDPNPMHLCNRDFIGSSIFEKLEELKP